LVGRDEALGQFAHVRASARLGDPANVLVTGDAGIGKSRLVLETCRHLKEGGTCCTVTPSTLRVAMFRSAS
jgi:predicted ATPase